MPGPFSGSESAARVHAHLGGGEGLSTGAVLWDSKHCVALCVVTQLSL